MIIVQVAVDSDGCLKYLSAAGHSGLSVKGKDVLCSAVTVLLRTAARVLSDEIKESVFVRAEDPGRMEIKIFSCPDSEKGWLKGLSDMILYGLMDLREEYPGNIDLVLLKED